MNLKSTLKRDSLLNISLNAMRRVLERTLELKTVHLVTGDRVKAIQRIEQTRVDRPNDDIAKKTSVYPYGFFIVNELANRRDYVVNNVAMRRHGLHLLGADETMGSTRKAFLFPMRLGIELHYLTADPQDAFITSQALLLLGTIKGLSFTVKVSGVQWTTFVEFPDSASIPQSTAEEPAQPGAMELSLSFSVTTMSGFFQDVAAVQHSAPQLNVDVELNLNKVVTDSFSFTYEPETTTN